MTAIRPLQIGRFAPSAVACAVALTLAACGGGGGSDPRVTVPTGVRSVAASAGADLTTANAATVAAPVVRSISGTGAGDVLPLGASARQAGPLGAVQFDRLVRLAVRPAVPRERIAQASAQPLGCISGFGSISFTDADGDQEPGRGDSITLDTTNCVLDGSLPAVSGRFTLTINVAELRGNELVGLDVSATLVNFGAAGYGTATGNFNLWTRTSGATTTARLSYQGSVMTEVVNGTPTSVTYNFDTLTRVTGGVASTEISGGIGIGGQTYVLETVTPLTGMPEPIGGALRIKDAQGDYVQITALNATSFDLAFYLASDPVNPALSLPGQRWDDYRL
jgi:hypothetical protein